MLDVSENTEAGTKAGASACSLVNWPPKALPLVVPFCTICWAAAGRPLPLRLLLFPVDVFPSPGSVGVAVAVLGGAMFDNLMQDGWRQRFGNTLVVGGED